MAESATVHLDELPFALRGVAVLALGGLTGQLFRKAGTDQVLVPAVDVKANLVVDLALHRLTRGAEAQGAPDAGQPRARHAGIASRRAMIFETAATCLVHRVMRSRSCRLPAAVRR